MPPSGSGVSGTRHTLAGKVAPDFETLKSLSSKPSSDALVVEFWASWCKGCKQSLTTLGELSKQESGVSVLGISIDEKRKSFESFARINAGEVPLVWDEKQTLAAKYRVSQLPSTFIIDSHGLVCAVLVGESAADSELLSDLERRCVEPLNH